MRIKRLLIISLVLLVTVLSCRKDNLNPNWDVALLAPVLSAKLSLSDLLNDTLMHAGGDGLVSLVYHNQLYRFSLDSFINMPDTSYRFSAYLDSLKLSNMNIQHNITLGQIIQSAGLGFLLPDGSSSAVAPITGITSDNIPIDATQYFQTMTLTTGFLDITITNHLPIDLTNVIFQVRNSNNNSVVLQDTFPLISIGNSVSKSFSLAGMTVNGSMIGKIINMDSPGSGGNIITIHYTDALITILYIHDLKPYAATAIFPSQNLMNKTDRLIFALNDLQLTGVVIRSGNVELDAYNTITDPLYFTYSIPGCTLNGDTLKVSGMVDPAVGGQASVLHQVHSLAGYRLDLRGAGPIEQFFHKDLNHNGYIDADTINTVFITALGRIDSTGHLISLSLQDSFIFKSRLQSLVPEYAYGYLGRDTFKSAASIGFNVFKGLDHGSISMADTKISLVVDNQVGASAKVNFNNIKAINSKTNAKVSLAFPAGSNPLSIAKPQDPMSLTVPVTPTVTTMKLDHTNSNAQDMISIIPDKISYNIMMNINPGIPPPPLATGTDFVYYDGILTASLDVEVPLWLTATGLVLTDTADFNLKENDIKKLLDGKLYLIASNMFPLTAHVQLFVLDKNLVVVDSLFTTSEKLSAGVLPQGNDRVISPTVSKLVMNLSHSKLEMLTQEKKIRIVSRFDTTPVGQHVKIYSDYTIEFKVTGDFNYHVN